MKFVKVSFNGLELVTFETHEPEKFAYKVMFVRLISSKAVALKTIVEAVVLKVSTGSFKVTIGDVMSAEELKLNCTFWFVVIFTIVPFAVYPLAVTFIV